MSKIPLIDSFDFQVSQDILKESLEKHGKLIVRGVIQRADAKNQNNRVYPYEILAPQVQKYEQLVNDRRAMGELDHSQSSVISLANVSHLLTNLEWQGKDLYGTFEILTTPSGNILRELFMNGVKIGISSRGLGSVKRTAEGYDEVDEDFELICWDMVSNPSTHGSFVFPVNEGVEPSNFITDKYEKVNSIVRDIFDCLQPNKF